MKQFTLLKVYISLSLALCPFLVASLWVFFLLALEDILGHKFSWRKNMVLVITLID